MKKPVRGERGDPWTLPQPHPEPGDDPREVCCTCGLRGRQCIELPCWHQRNVADRGYVYGNFR